MTEEQLQDQRHSLAHLLAAAVETLYPSAKRATGPATETGFFYDYQFEVPLVEKDLPAIEEKMRELLPSFTSFDRQEVSLTTARQAFADNPFKMQLIDEIEAAGQGITLYKSGAFVDLCRGGHAGNISSIDPKSFKLDRLAGAYWKGDEKNPMLTRIYGLAFATADDLQNYEAQRIRAQELDHKKLGRELDLFFFSDLVGSGLPLWTPRGTIVRNLLDQYVWELRKQFGYEKVEIPHITKKDLYMTSGHWEKFSEELFKVTTREGHEFAMKPMNCPHHTQIFARKPWSYRQLPQRYANTTMCYRDEQTGELNGLTRARSLTQDDAHVFCRFDQINEEVEKIWNIIHAFYPTFNFSLQVRLSTRDPKILDSYLGEPGKWDQAERMLKELTQRKDTPTTNGEGEAAFYGPKLDFTAVDSLGRTWQLATIQLDFVQPERFGLYFINSEGKKETPVMIHAAIMGSIERFIGVMLEHLAGNLPVWLAPTQLALLPVSSDQLAYAKHVAEKITELMPYARIETIEDGNSLGKRIREVKQSRIPYIGVIGTKETEANTIAIKKNDGTDLGTLPIEEVVHLMSAEYPSAFPRL